MVKQKVLYKPKDFPFSPPVFAKLPPKIMSKYGVWFEECIYYFWFEYLRRSNKYWLACKKNGLGMEKLYADFGDVFKVTFDEWFVTDVGGVVRGVNLFAYRGFKNTFEVIDAARFGCLDLNDHFVVAINKFANKKKTLRQVGDIWKKKVASSKARFKSALYLPRSNTHNINSLKEYLKIYDAKLLELKHWECVASARRLDFDKVPKHEREYFNIIASKALKKAKKLIALTEQGQFI
jgi:hypothetical protein